MKQRRRHKNLKTQSILWISGLVLVLSSLTLATFATMRLSLNQLSGMIDITITANNLRALTGSVTEGLPAEMEAYSLHPREREKSKILAKFSEINKHLTNLELEVTHEEGRVKLALIKNMFTTMSESFSEIELLVQQGGSFSEVNSLIANVKEGSGLIKDAIQELISIELMRQRAEKGALAKRIDENAAILLAAIILLSIAGVGLFYVGFLRGRILGPLNTMRVAMDKIANDTGDISTRVPVEREDEIGQLAEYFNKMADAIQKFKESLEDLVEVRTRQLAEAQARLVQSEKFSALGEMAGGIAHEINNPLAVIQLNAAQLSDFAQDEVVDKAALVRCADTIDITVNRIAKIVKGLRSFSRNAANDPFDATLVKAIVEDTLSLCGEKVKLTGVKIEVSVPQEATVECRSTEISQVLLNLLSNATDALRAVPGSWIKIEAHERGPIVEIWVTDSGGGIPEKVQQKIFQPFFTTKEVGKGTGLGLSVSKGIIEQHGGSLAIDPQSPNTRFVIRLPRTQADRLDAKT